MQSFRQYLHEQMLTERFINLIGDDSDKEKYVDAVWDLLQYSYKDIGGIRGSGFRSPEDMMKNIPFWKVATSGGRVVAVSMYKDKGGRKVAAVGTDGSKEGKRKIIDMMGNEMERSFGEKSKGALGLMMKLIPWNVLEQYVMTPEQAAQAFNKDVTPVTDLDPNEIPADGVQTLQKYPQLKPYAYVRELAGKPAFKVAIGTPGIRIR